MMDVLDITEAFVHIAEAGSISKAALCQRTTQATMSRKLKKLEAFLHCELITRTTRSFDLTEAGESFLVDARDLVVQWHHIHEKYRHRAGRLENSLTVIVPGCLGQTMIAPWAAEFQREGSGVIIDLQTQEELVTVPGNPFDLWIRYGNDSVKGMTTRPLAIIRQAIVCTPELTGKKPLRGVSDVEKLPYVINESNGKGKAIQLMSTSSHRTRTLYPNPATAASNTFATYQAVKQGTGFGVLPYWLIEDDLEGGELMELLPEWRTHSQSVQAIYRRSDNRAESIERFVDHISRRLNCKPGIRVMTNTRLVSVA